MLRITSLAVWSLSTMVGCGSDDKASVAANAADAVSGAFLSPAHFASEPSTGTLSEQALLAQLQGASIFRVHNPKADLPEPPPETQGCGIVLDRVSASETGHGLLIQVLSNSTGCEEEADASVHKETQIYLQVTCPGTDLASLPFNERSGSYAFTNLNYRGLCLRDDQASVIMNARILVRQGEAGAQKTAELFGAYMASNGRPCVLQADESAGTGTYADCGYYYKLKETDEASGIVTVKNTAAQFFDLTAAPGETYYRSGEINFQFDDWNGVVTYSSDGAAPTFTGASENLSTSGSL